MSEYRQSNELIKNIEQHRFWFVDIPRTSSTSIKTELGQKYGAPYGKTYDFPTYLCEDHTSAVNARNKIGHELYDDIFTFSIVRNPFDRVYSFYKYRITHYKDVSPTTTFDQYINKIRRFYDKKGNDSKVFYDNQCCYLLDSNGDRMVKYVGKLEERTQAIKKINQNLSNKLTGQHWLISTKEFSESYKDVYSYQSKRLISKLYEKDLDEFKYSFVK